jgi:hypothetical protein
MRTELRSSSGAASSGPFMNKYSALPMALTGALSNKTAARRVKETATFFTTTVIPGALDRHGAGFKSAAMVRLMHSMVRFNVLTRGDQWDVKTYGVPIPQIDQMPVALMPIFPLAQKALRKGRTTFTPAERARVDLARYRGYSTRPAAGAAGRYTAEHRRHHVDALSPRSGKDSMIHALVSSLRRWPPISCPTTPCPAGCTPGWSGGSASCSSSQVHAGRQACSGRRRRPAWVADYLGAAAAAILITSTMTAYTIAARIPVISRCG